MRFNSREEHQMYLGSLQSLVVVARGVIGVIGDGKYLTSFRL
jgi:hypothetical protein